MTIDDLLEHSAAELEAMSEQELIECLSPWFKFCRPGPDSLVKRQQKNLPSTATHHKNKQKSNNLDFKMVEASNNLMAALLARSGELGLNKK